MKGGLRKRCSDKWKKFSLRDTVHGVLPITHWLPRYKPKEYLPGDIAAGLALGIMNIPQGKQLTTEGDFEQTIRYITWSVCNPLYNQCIRPDIKY